MRGGGLFVLLRLAGHAVDQVELDEKFGLLESGFTLLPVFGLEAAELLQVSLHVAIDALPVDAQELEFAGVIEECPGVGEGDPDRIVLLVTTQREYVGLEGTDTVETPAVLSDGVGELLFHGRFGIEAFNEPIDKGVVRFAIFGGEDRDLAGEPVTQVVSAGTGFAFDGFRAGGTYRVAAVRFELLLGGHSSISRLSTAVEHKEPGMVTLEVAKRLKTGCEYFLKFVNG